MKVKSFTNLTSGILAANMECGQIGIVKGDYPQKGGHLLRTYDGLVLLEHPNSTWDIGPALGSPSFMVDVLPVGDKVELETEI